MALIFALILVAFSAAPLAALADGENQIPGNDVAPSKESANFGKSSEYLPGEEVVSPTGQKLKIWSTRGPVPVSQAPAPFDDREKTILNDSNIVVDEGVLNHLLDNNQRPASPGDRTNGGVAAPPRPATGSHDSFAIGR